MREKQNGFNQGPSKACFSRGNWKQVTVTVFEQPYLQIVTEIVLDEYISRFDTNPHRTIREIV